LYALTNALYQFATENDGNFPEASPGIPKITTDPADAGTSELNLGTDLVPTYMAVIPSDPGPLSNPPTVTLYRIHLDATGRLVATAASELNVGQVITVSR
jgi:hypothetical protein